MNCFEAALHSGHVMLAAELLIGLGRWSHEPARIEKGTDRAPKCPARTDLLAERAATAAASRDLRRRERGGREQRDDGRRDSENLAFHFALLVCGPAHSDLTVPPYALQLA